MQVGKFLENTLDVITTW